MKYILSLIFALALAGSIKLAYDLYEDVHLRKEMMEDYAEINMVNYELFNMQLWKEKALAIVKKKIREFGFTQETYDVLDDQIRGYLRAMHKVYFEQGELSEIIIDEVKKNGSLNPFMVKMIEGQVPGLIKQLNLKPQIPILSRQIVAEIKNNEPLIKEYMQQELLRLVLDEESRKYVDRREQLYAKYDQPNLEAADQYLSDQVQAKDAEIHQQIKYLVGAVIALILIALLMGNVIGFKLMVASLTLGSIVLLVLGVSLPMIDIDARLNSFIFQLFDESIEFDEQVVYYQSKSIVEVTKTLWIGGAWDLKLVGVLVFLFSIVFPFCKLILSGLYTISDAVKNSKLAKGFIFHLGKWSMADVFVVAIFMAYIGFYGIISTQLNGINQNQGGFAIETVNYSRLAPGAFFFTAYTILSIAISIMINRKDKSEAEIT